MKKGSRYGLALLACLGIFAIWILIQVFAGGGVILAILFCSAMVGAWKGIVGKGEQSEEPKSAEDTPESIERSDEQTTDVES